MAKVKEEGNVPLDWKMEVRCEKIDEHDSKSKGCNALPEVEEKDLVLRYWEGTHFTHHYAAVKCPCCGKYIRVDVPDSAWERINTSRNRRKSTSNGLDASI